MFSVTLQTTRVGEGIFKTEDVGEAGDKLQEIGKECRPDKISLPLLMAGLGLGREWGVSTGRKRRCGWLDLVVLKYSTTINHYTVLNLTKLDVLDSFPSIRVCCLTYRVGNKHPGQGWVERNANTGGRLLSRTRRLMALRLTTYRPT